MLVPQVVAPPDVLSLPDMPQADMPPPDASDLLTLVPQSVSVDMGTAVPSVAVDSMPDVPPSPVAVNLEPVSLPPPVLVLTEHSSPALSSSVTLVSNEVFPQQVLVQVELTRLDVSPLVPAVVRSPVVPSPVGESST